MTSSFSNNMGGIAEGDMGGTQEKKGRKKVAKACLACQKSHVTCDDRESTHVTGFCMDSC
jgi:hypothetical protein